MSLTLPAVAVVDSPLCEREAVIAADILGGVLIWLCLLMGSEGEEARNTGQSIDEIFQREGSAR